MIIAAIGASTIIASAPIMPSGLSSSSPPPKRNENVSSWAMPEIAPAIIAATDCTRMSRFLMWANSWARTPSSW